MDPMVSKENKSKGTIIGFWIGMVFLAVAIIAVTMALYCRSC